MGDTAKAMVLASFVGDALALGVHWIYDQSLIATAHGRIKGLTTPAPGSYHPGKTAGDFTHYGDQSLVLLESVAAVHGFDPKDFSIRWQALFAGGYVGYVDRASRNTLDHLAGGWEYPDAGSGSDDLAGASRIAPIVYAYRDDLDAMVQAVRTQTVMTHNNAKVADAAEFFARTAHAVLHGQPPIQAMGKALASRLPGSPLHAWLEQGLAAAGQDSIPAIAAFGQSCHIDGAFQGVVQLIARHENALAEAFVDSAMAGGDSAARNMLVGVVLGAHGGIAALPAEWLEGMKAKGKIESLVDKIG